MFRINSMEIIDIHSHLLPKVDDSRLKKGHLKKMLETIAEAGIAHQVFTPHIDDPYVDTKAKLIMPVYEKACTIAESLGLHVHLASEYYVRDQKEFSFIPLEGKYVLCETDTSFAPPSYLDVLRRIREKGYTIILAHVERYRWLSVDSDIFRTLTGELEALVQVNVSGARTENGRSYLRAGVVDFIATDNHGDFKLPYELYEILGQYPGVMRKMSAFAQNL